MHELKVRGWDTKKNVMYSAEEMGRDQLTLSPDGRGFINVHGKSTRLSKFYDHIIPLQYTTLKDKNGKEGCQDDIALCSDGKHGLVVWKDGGWYLKKRSKVHVDEWYQYIVLSYCAESLEFVGNIHENPELMETETE